MLLTLVLAEIATAAATAPDRQARASVRIERPAKIGEAYWKDSPAPQRREVVRQTPEGRTEIMRIVDHQ